MKNRKRNPVVGSEVLAQYRSQILQAALEIGLPIRAEEGVEACYQTTRKDDPDTLFFRGLFIASPLRFAFSNRTSQADLRSLSSRDLRTSWFLLS